MPPLDEQRTIVRQLKTMLLEIDAGQRLLSATDERWVELQASLFEAAYTGELVGARRSSGLASAWPLVPLVQLASDEPRAITDGPFGSNLKSAHYTDSGPRVIRLQNVGEGVLLNAEAHISEDHFATLWLMRRGLAMSSWRRLAMICHVPALSQRR